MPQAPRPPSAAGRGSGRAKVAPNSLGGPALPRARGGRGGGSPRGCPCLGRFFLVPPLDAPLPSAPFAPPCPGSRPFAALRPFGGTRVPLGPRSAAVSRLNASRPLHARCLRVGAPLGARVYAQAQNPLDTSVHHPLRGVPWRSAGTPRVPESRGAPTVHGAPMGLQVVYQCGFKKK